MRVECGSCKRLAEGRFELADGGAVTVACGACGAIQTAPLEAPAARPAAVALEDLCPKCGAPRAAGAGACAACGLASEKMAAYADARDAAVPEDLRAAWLALQGAWSEPARHDALLLVVARHGCYAWAAGRYRDAARARPSDAVAPRQLERLRRAGEATMFATATVRPERGKTPYAAVIGILVLLLAAIAAGVIYASMSSNDPPSPAQVR